MPRLSTGNAAAGSSAGTGQIGVRPRVARGRVGARSIWPSPTRPREAPQPLPAVLAHVGELLDSLAQQVAGIETGASPTDTAARNLLVERIAAVRGLVASAGALDALGGAERARPGTGPS
jgi:hypothetical protein